METKRLILRRFSHDDWKDLYEYLSREEAVKYEPYEAYTGEMCRREALERARREAFWAVCLKNDGKLIGNVYFSRREPPEFLTWEIGYVFNPTFWGRGYATEACRRILAYGFERLGARRVIALCNPENESSWKLLERLDMRREGHLRRNIFFKRGERGEPLWNDTYEYAILADEWLPQSQGTCSE